MTSLLLQVGGSSGEKLDRAAFSKVGSPRPQTAIGPPRQWPDFSGCFSELPAVGNNLKANLGNCSLATARTHATFLSLLSIRQLQTHVHTRTDTRHPVNSDFADYYSNVHGSLCLTTSDNQSELLLFSAKSKTPLLSSPMTAPR